MQMALRRLLWCVRVARAAIWGWGIRSLRRMLRLQPRIWHGMSPVHFTPYIVQADRIAGYHSCSIVYHSRQASYALVRDRDFDRVIEQPHVSWCDVHWLCLIDLLLHGDIWVAYYDCLFFRPDQSWANTIAFLLLRLMRIRIIVTPHGGDINHCNRYVSRFDWTRRFQQDYPEWDVTEQRATAKQRIRFFSSFANLVVVPDSSLGRFLPRKDILFKYFPIDCDALRPAESPANPTPVIVHAPNHRYTKGTDSLLNALDSLRCKGIQCELILIERMPRHEALEHYRQADIIADQFCIGAFGVFALEGMALGKPVLTYLDQEHLGDPVFNLPLVNTNLDNLVQVLAVLLQVPVLRERIGQASRASVEQYQSIPALAEVWDRIYRHVWWGNPLILESTRHFDPAREARCFTEDPSRADFWPVPVDDLLPQIHRGLLAAGFRVDNHCTSYHETLNVSVS